MHTRHCAAQAVTTLSFCCQIAIAQSASSSTLHAQAMQGIPDKFTPVTFDAKGDGIADDAVALNAIYKVGPEQSAEAYAARFVS